MGFTDQVTTTAESLLTTAAGLLKETVKQAAKPMGIILNSTAERKVSPDPYITNCHK